MPGGRASSGACRAVRQLVNVKLKRRAALTAITYFCLQNSCSYLSSLSLSSTKSCMTQLSLAEGEIDDQQRQTAALRGAFHHEDVCSKGGIRRAAASGMQWCRLCQRLCSAPPMSLHLLGPMVAAQQLPAEQHLSAQPWHPNLLTASIAAWHGTQISSCAPGSPDCLEKSGVPV